MQEQPRIRIKVVFKNPKHQPIKTTIYGSVADAKRTIRDVVGLNSGTDSNLVLASVWGQTYLIAANDILYVELEEA